MKRIITIISSFTMSICTLNAQTSAIDTAHIFYTKMLALNLDGAAHAYHPNNEGMLHNLNGGITKQEALQNRFNGKKRGYGIAKKQLKGTNVYEGYISPDGYFVSQTYPYNKNKPDSSSAAYADAETIPYITWSPGWIDRGIRNCDIAYVVNLDNGKQCAAIFADKRGNDKETEISLALAKALDIHITTKQDTSYDGKKGITRYKGINNNRLKIYYFKHSGDSNGKTSEEIQQMGKKLMGKL